jgi:endonuclease/exonuclease/phosphatase family metal-dependent hydrolase
VLTDFGCEHSFARAAGSVLERYGARIDFIFVRPGDQIRNAQVIYDHDDGRYPSDHFPVLAVVRL